MRELLQEMTSALEQGRPGVWCAVVETRGSTPQKAGAVMLVHADGTQSGTLGGGCVEAEVKQKALRLLAQPDAMAAVHTFSLDDNYGWDDGLICGGRMTMLIDPQPERGGRNAEYYQRLQSCIQSGVGCVEAVIIAESAGLPLGSRYLFDTDRRLLAQRAPRDAPDALHQQVPDLRQRPRPSVAKGIAFLPVLPRIRLFIVGGGHVGQAVGKLAAEVDFDIWALDDREKYACRERFPAAQRIVVGDIGQTLKQMNASGDITPETYCLIVTRGHSHDEEALYHLATTDAGYVGMIGSKRKIKLIFEDLRARGIGDDVLAKVHAPLGFDIGSQTVPEIAISIVAELIACRNLGTEAPQRRRDTERTR